MKAKTKKKLLTTFIVTFALIIAAFTGTEMAKASTIIKRVEVMPKVELYQLAPENQSLMECYVIKTINNKIIVFDGGIDGAGLEAKPFLPSAIRAILGLNQDDNFEVEAWFLSHAHIDHYGELRKMLNSYNAESDNYKIKNFYFDFPDLSRFPASEWSEESLNELKTGINNYAIANGIESSDYYSEVNGKYVNKATIDAGLVFDIDGVKIEILQTHDESDSILNSTSMIQRVWVDGQSVLFLNDCYADSGNRLLNKYGSKLKSDIVQMAHHGQSGVDKNVYEAVDAKVHLWSTPKWVWDNVDGAFQTDVVRGWVGADKVADKYNVVSGLYENYPADSTSVAEWKKCVSEMKINLPYVNAYESVFYADEGAYLRLDEGTTGIRFSATLASYDPSCSYGFVIVPKYYLTINNITSDYIPQLIEKYGEDGIIKMYSRVVQKGAVYKILGSISNILYENINLEFVGIPFEYKDGNYCYAAFNAEECARTVPYLASAALNDYYYNDELSSETKELYKNNLSVINGFINKSINKTDNVPIEESNNEATINFSFDKTAYSAGWGEKIETKITTNIPNANVIYESDNSDVTIDKNGVISSHSLTTANITAKCVGKTTTTTVSFEMPDAMSADFSNTNYLKQITLDSTYGDVTGSFKTEWLDEFNGEKGVVKITLKNNTSNNTGAVNIKLPREHKGKVAAKMYVVSTEIKPSLVGFMDSDGSYKGYFNNELVFDCWKEYLSETLEQKDTVTIANYGIGAELVLYISYIKIVKNIEEIKLDLADKLNGSYLADFSNVNYGELVTPYAPSGAGTVDTEYFESYQGETNVLKISGYPNASQWWYSGFNIELPKSATGTIEVKFMIGHMNAEGHNLEYGGTSVNIGSSVNIWQNVQLANTTGESVSQIRFNCWRNSASDINVADVIIYISYVKIVKSIEEIKSDLADSLIDPAVADFSNDDYLALISEHSDYYSADGAFKKEWISGFNGQNGVVKITLKCNIYNNLSGFVLNLPKNHNGKVVAKIYIEADNSKPSLVGFLENGSWCGYCNGDNLKFNVWNDLMSTELGVKDSISVGIEGAGAECVMYIAYVDAV